VRLLFSTDALSVLSRCGWPATQSALPTITASYREALFCMFYVLEILIRFNWKKMDWFKLRLKISISKIPQTQSQPDSGKATNSVNEL